MTNKNEKLFKISKSFVSSIIFMIINVLTLFGQSLPKIIGDNKTIQEHYLPDFSFAGYYNGEKAIQYENETIVLASDYGVIANDELDDSKALNDAMQAANKINGHVILQLPQGKLILSDILYIERSHFVLRGTGAGINGTELYYPRPMMYLKDPESLKELREYLIEFDKRQIEKENNINLPFSQFAWSGGFIWTQVPGERVKSYLRKYDEQRPVLANVLKGNRGEHTFFVTKINGLKVGDVVELQLFNKEGENGSIITDLYQNTPVKVGTHHWHFPMLPMVRQQVEITKINNNKVTIKTPLTISIKPSYEAKLVTWPHLQEVGIEHIRITFPNTPRVAHHVEQGYNAIYLTRLFNGWVKDVVIDNAESGILTEEIANVTIKDIVTTGQNMAHYTVAMAAVHNVLVKNLKVFNNAVHPLSFNTFSTKNVYQNCEVYTNPILDQHSGANHQNLFDNITVYLNPLADNSYPLFAGGGASYWKPSHGAFTTFWNLNVQTLSKLHEVQPLKLNGMLDGPLVRIIGVHGNRNFNIEYEPQPYIEYLNRQPNNIPSLYDYQLSRRLN